MRRLVLLALLLGTLPVAGARADQPVEGPRGLPCRWITAVRSSGDDHTGYLTGGPYLASGTLTCSVGDTSLAATGTNVVALRPTPVAVTTTSWQPLVRVCTTFTPEGGPTLYWHSTLVAGVGHWSLRPSWRCGIDVNADQPTSLSDLDPLFYCCQEGWTDSIVCEFFFLAAGGVEGVVTIDPDDGDVFVAGEPFWDCPPYELYS